MADPVAATKSRLRREVLRRVLDMDPADRRVEEARLADRLPALPGFAAAQVVLMHVSAFPDEVDTRPLLELVLDAGKRLVCPRINLDLRQLDLCEVRNPSVDLEAGYRRLIEPVAACRLVAPLEVDWALVPGIAFDPLGFRLGRGGGYYDRLLPTLKPSAACWALVLSAQLVPGVPREPHDCPLSGVADHREIRPGFRPR